jgi:uncharacterized protein with HEPN domain
MPRDILQYLEDIVNSAEAILKHTAGFTWETFSKDQLRIDAVLFNLFVIGAAVRNIPDDLRTQHPTVQWGRINALRNVIAHEYFAVKLRTIWTIVEENIPELLAEIRKVVDDFEG